MHSGSSGLVVTGYEGADLDGYEVPLTPRLLCRDDRI